MSIKRTLSALAIAALIFGLQSCYEVTTLTIDNSSPVTDEVSFTKDIVPIFNKSCNGSGCHNSGGIRPDLSETTAYVSLVNGSYMNVADPENSELYKWINSERAVGMPVGGPVNPDNLNNLVLAWIEQGANNN